MQTVVAHVNAQLVAFGMKPLEDEKIVITPGTTTQHISLEKGKFSKSKSITSGAVHFNLRANPKYIEISPELFYEYTPEDVLPGLEMFPARGLLGLTAKDISVLDMERDTQQRLVDTNYRLLDLASTLAHEALHYRLREQVKKARAKQNPKRVLNQTQVNAICEEAVARFVGYRVREDASSSYYSLREDLEEGRFPSYIQLRNSTSYDDAHYLALALYFLPQEQEGFVEGFLERASESRAIQPDQYDLLEEALQQAEPELQPRLFPSSSSLEGHYNYFYNTLISSMRFDEEEVGNVMREMSWMNDPKYRTTVSKHQLPLFEQPDDA